jgi:hypothetical protein
VGWQYGRHDTGRGGQRDVHEELADRDRDHGVDAVAEQDRVVAKPYSTPKPTPTMAPTSAMSSASASNVTRSWTRVSPSARTSADSRGMRASG